MAAVAAKHIQQEVLHKLESIRTDLETKLQALFADIKAKAPQYRATLENKVIEVMKSDIFKGVTRTLHVVRVAITILTLGIINPTRLPVLFAKIAKGASIIYKTTRDLPPCSTKPEAFIQNGVDEKKSLLNKLLNKAMTPKQQEVAHGTVIIAGAILEAGLFPVAMVTAGIDAALLARQVKAMPSLSELVEKAVPQHVRDFIAV